MSKHKNGKNNAEGQNKLTTADVAWGLFKETGEINYYLLYKRTR